MPVTANELPFCFLLVRRVERATAASSFVSRNAKATHVFILALIEKRIHIGLASQLLSQRGCNHPITLSLSLSLFGDVPLCRVVLVAIFVLCHLVNACACDLSIVRPLLSTRIYRHLRFREISSSAGADHRHAAASSSLTAVDLSTAFVPDFCSSTRTDHECSPLWLKR